MEKGDYAVFRNINFALKLIPLARRMMYTIYTHTVLVYIYIALLYFSSFSPSVLVMNDILMRFVRRKVLRVCFLTERYRQWDHCNCATEGKAARLSAYFTREIQNYERVKSSKDYLRAWKFGASAIKITSSFGTRATRPSLALGIRVGTRRRGKKKDGTRLVTTTTTTGGVRFAEKLGNSTEARLRILLLDGRVAQGDFTRFLEVSRG